MPWQNPTLTYDAVASVSQVRLEVVNHSIQGSGNDWALDDVGVRLNCPAALTTATPVPAATPTGLGLLLAAMLAWGGFALRRKPANQPR